MIDVHILLIHFCTIEHEGPVTAAHISYDGIKILAGTCTVSFMCDFFTNLDKAFLSNHSKRHIVGSNKIVVFVLKGNIGILDVSTRGYTTVMRSHVDRVLSASLDPIRRHLATVSSDHTIRIWDLDSMQQVSFNL